MKAADCMIAWTPDEDAPTFRANAAATPGTVTVVPWPDNGRRSDPHQSTVGACNDEWREADEITRTAMVFITFHSMVARDGVPVAAAHNALLAIDEYRAHVSRDIEGADDGPSMLKA